MECFSDQTDGTSLAPKQEQIAVLYAIDAAGFRQTVEARSAQGSEGTLPSVLRLLMVWIKHGKGQARADPGTSAFVDEHIPRYSKKYAEAAAVEERLGVTSKTLFGVDGRRSADQVQQVTAPLLFVG
eukprot:1161724-Pelagomonas_calceolata.AAC.4